MSASAPEASGRSGVGLTRLDRLKAWLFTGAPARTAAFGLEFAAALGRWALERRDRR